MAGKQTHVLLNGQWASATVVPVNQSQELWNEYLLEDGSVLKIKVIVSEVAKVDGMYELDGTPVYNAKWNAVMAVSSPLALKKPPTEGK